LLPSSNFSFLNVASIRTLQISDGYNGLYNKLDFKLNMDAAKANERWSRLKNCLLYIKCLNVSFSISRLTASIFSRNTSKVSYGISCTTSVFTRWLLLIRKVAIVTLLEYLTFYHWVTSGAQLELTLKISLIGIEFYIFFNWFLFDFLLNIHL
jgi:hypothetical protein